MNALHVNSEREVKFVVSRCAGLCFSALYNRNSSAMDDVQFCLLGNIRNLFSLSKNEVWEALEMQLAKSWGRLQNQYHNSSDFWLIKLLTLHLILLTLQCRESKKLISKVTADLCDFLLLNEKLKVQSIPSHYSRVRCCSVFIPGYNHSKTRLFFPSEVFGCCWNLFRSG